MYTVKELNEFLKVSSIENLRVSFFYDEYNAALLEHELFIGYFDFNKGRRSCLQKGDLLTIPSWMNDMKIQQVSCVARESMSVKILVSKGILYEKTSRALHLEFFEIPKTLDELGRAISENGDTDKIGAKLRELIRERDELVKDVAEAKAKH